MRRESTRARRKIRAARRARTLKPALCSAWFSTTSICIRVDGFAGFVVPSLRCDPGLMSDLLAASGAGSFGLQHAQPMTATVWRRGGLCGGAEAVRASDFRRREFLQDSGMRGGRVSLVGNLASEPCPDTP